MPVCPSARLPRPPLDTLSLPGATIPIAMTFDDYLASAVAITLLLAVIIVPAMGRDLHELVYTGFGTALGYVFKTARNGYFARRNHS